VVLVVKPAIRRAWLWSRRNPVTLVLVVSALFAWAALADTRHDAEIIEKTVQQSPCTINPASVACQTSKRESDRERSLADTCIPFRKALTRHAYRVVTRCPYRKGVVAQNSQNASQPPGPSGGNDQDRPGRPQVPDEPDRPDNPSRPSNPEPPSKPSTPSKPSEPSRPEQPSSPAPKPVQVTAPGVAVEAGNGGACVGVSGIRLTLGNC
jgi:hypothetical protein